MTHETNVTRRAAFATALGLTLAPVVLATAASAEGGLDPSDQSKERWKPEYDRKDAKKDKKPQVTKQQ